MNASLARCYPEHPFHTQIKGLNFNNKASSFHAHSSQFAEMVVTRSGRAKPIYAKGKSRTSRKKFPHDHHSPKASKVAMEDSYELKRVMTNADAEVNSPDVFVSGKTLEPHEGELQNTPTVMSSEWNTPTGRINASQRENCMVFDFISDDIGQRASSFFQRSNHDDPNPSERKMSLPNWAGHKNLATVGADMNSSQREDNVASKDLHFTPKEVVYGAKRSLSNAKADVHTQSAMAAGETFIPHHGVDNLQTAPPEISSLWNSPTADNNALQREADMVIGNISNDIEERANNLFQMSSLDDPTSTAKKASTPDVVFHKNLATCTTEMNLSQMENDVASNDINNAAEDFARNIHHQPSKSFNLTEIAEQLNDDDLFEVDSVGGDTSLVSVEGYKVRPEDKNLLSSILSKHGDIAANCSHESNIIRSYFMQNLCDFIRKLKNSSITFISQSELECMLSFLNDMERACVEVGWLKNRLQEIHEAKLAIPMLRPSSELKQARAEQKSNIQRTKKQLKVLMNEVSILNNQLAIDEDEAAKMDKVILEYKAKLKHIVELGSLDHDLL